MKHKPDLPTLDERLMRAARRCARCGRDADGPTKCPRFVFHGTPPRLRKRASKGVTGLLGTRGSPLAWRP